MSKITLSFCLSAAVLTAFAGCRSDDKMADTSMSASAEMPRMPLKTSNGDPIYAVKDPMGTLFLVTSEEHAQQAIRGELKSDVVAVFESGKKVMVEAGKEKELADAYFTK